MTDQTVNTLEIKGKKFHTKTEHITIVKIDRNVSVSVSSGLRMSPVYGVANYATNVDTSVNNRVWFKNTEGVEGSFNIGGGNLQFREGHELALGTITEADKKKPKSDYIFIQNLSTNTVIQSLPGADFTKRYGSFSLWRFASKVFSVITWMYLIVFLIGAIVSFNGDQYSDPNPEEGLLMLGLSLVVGVLIWGHRKIINKFHDKTHEALDLARIKMMSRFLGN